MSVHAHNKMNLQDIANYFIEPYKKQKLKTLSFAEVRNIYESLQNLVKQEKQLKPHPSKINMLKQSSVIESKIEPNISLNQKQAAALKDIQSQLIISGYFQTYKDELKTIAQKNNLPYNILQVIQRQYVIWYKVLNDLYPIFYETKPKYQDIDGKTLAQKCSWLSGQIATKIKDKSKYLIQQLGIKGRKCTQNLNQLIKLFQQEKDNMKKELSKLFPEQQKANESPQRNEKKYNIEKQRQKVKESLFTFGPGTQTEKKKSKQSIGNKKQEENVKKNHKQKAENKIKQLQNQIQKKKNEINRLIIEHDKKISDLNEKIWKIQGDKNEKTQYIKKLQQQKKSIIKYSEQKIKKIQKQQRKLRQTCKSAEQFLQNFQKLMKNKQKATFMKIYYHIQQQNKRMQKIFDKIYQMYKNENPGVHNFIDENSLDQKYKLIKQYLKIDNKLNQNINNSSIRSVKSRKPSNSQSQYFQNLSQEQQDQFKGNKDFRKQSTGMMTQSYKVTRSCIGGGAINKSDYSVQPEDNITQKTKQENNKLKQEIKNLEQQLAQKDEQIKKIHNDLKDKTMTQQKNSPKYFKHTLFYSGMFKQILKQRFVLDNLQTHLKNNFITNFNLLHRSIDPTDLLTDIQKHPNILFLALTKSGHSIAAYSSLSVCNTINTKQPKGLIMFTKSQECQQLKHKQKSVEKDNKFLTFNIGEIKLRINITKEQQQPLIIYFQTDNKQLMKRQKDESHKQIKNSTNQTKIQLQAYQFYQIKFNKNNLIEQKKQLQTLQVKPNILQQDRSRSTVEEMKSANKKLPSQTEQIRELKLKIEQYERNIKTLKQQNEELKGVGGNNRQSYSIKKSNVRQQSKGKYFDISNSLKTNKLTPNLSLKSQKNQKETQKPVDKKQQDFNLLNQKYIEQGQALKSSDFKLKAEQMRSNRLSIDKKQLQEKIKKKQKQMQELKKKFDKTKQLESQLIKKQEQINKLLQDSNQRRNQQSSSEEIQKMRQQISNLKKQLQVQRKKYQIRQTNLKKIQEQLANKQNQCKSNIQQLKKANEQIKTFKEEINNINKNNSIQKQSRLTQTKNKDNNVQIELKQILQKKKEEINELQNRIKQLQKTIGRLTEQIKNKQTKINELIKNQKIKQTRIKLLQDQGSQLNSKIQALKKESTLPKPTPQKKSITIQKQQNKGQLQKQRQMLQKIIKQRQEIESQIANKNKLLLLSIQRQKKLSQNIKQLESKSSKMGEQFQKVQKMVQNMDKIQQDKVKLEQNIKKLHENISTLVSQQKNKQDKLKQTQYNLNLIKKQLSEQISQKAKLQMLKKNIIQKQSQIIQKNDKIASLDSKITQAQKKLSQYQNQSKIKQNSQKNKLYQIQEQIKYNQQKLSTLQQKIVSKIQNDHNVAGFHQYFVGEIVENNLDRHYIVSQIQKVMCRQIKRTKLLFTYPLMNMNNPHISVDGIPNYIVLIKMKQTNKEGKNFTMAMFSEKALQKNNIMNNKRGFVCSVTNRQVFYLVKSQTNNPRLTQYHQFYIVFGNSEIIFRINSPLLQFKIGHNFKSLDTGTMKTGEIFTGSHQQKVQMEGYQIYQVMF